MSINKGSTKKTPLCFYGDDFTGATAHLAGFHDAGLRSLMFLNTPDEVVLKKHINDLDVLGIAGVGRSLPPENMANELIPAYRLFRNLGARNVHYKVCSTFDSSPTIGSIGKAIELAQQVFGKCHIPVAVGCPGFGRYVVFGNLFARYGNEVMRIDRHPTMAFHPSTPMNEADLLRHLSLQTSLKSCIIDIFALQGSEKSLSTTWVNSISDESGVVFFDTLTESDLDRIAALLWTESEKSSTPLFTIASQGLAQATGRYIARNGAKKKRNDEAAPVDLSQMLVLSGSASPQNEIQIKLALEAGWHGIRIDMERALSTADSSALKEEICIDIERNLQQGLSVIVYTASGPHDPAISSIIERQRKRQVSEEAISDAVGTMFAHWMRRAVERCGLRRIVLAGGDTSSHTMRKIDAYALRIAGIGISGGRLCRLLSDNPAFDNLEVMLKGGQVGGPSAFIDAAKASAWRV